MERLNLKCPECKKSVHFEGNSYFPFCSERCQLIDLGAWLEGRYVISGNEDEIGTTDSSLLEEDPKIKKGET
ncbi:MAG: DNA gyrase inhibitor YacG [Candidatus Tectomicrobia bacterium]|uniref:DNA gyrase inhibitor YacG n=1 Tax=Tectimicrobiota bacterium TaxID=2528274 RepID=A0A933GL18_UNCTE|nr:DNA gyrase inhibitor YacG [Candidatus Tectomicrobia bacterium]